jgi:hypothetical protein
MRISVGLIRDRSSADPETHVADDFAAEALFQFFQDVRTAPEFAGLGPAELRSSVLPRKRCLRTRHAR